MFNKYLFFHHSKEYSSCHIIQQTFHIYLETLISKHGQSFDIT